MQVLNNKCGARLGTKGYLLQRIEKKMLTLVQMGAVAHLIKISPTILQPI